MKKLIFSALIASVLLSFSACGSFNNYDAATDGIERIFNDVKRTVGEDGQIDEILIMFSKEDGKRSMIDYFKVDFQSKSDKNKLQRVAYHGHSGWTPIEPLEITIRGGNAADYDLNYDVSSISLVKPDVVKKIYDNALQYVGETCDDIIFTSISVDLVADEDLKYKTSLKGTLKSNGVKDSFYLDFDQDGNMTRK